MSKLKIGKKYFHADDMHGWLAVKMKEIEALGLANEISNFSYVLGKTVYLEEDVDMMKFLTAVQDAGIGKVEIRKAKHWAKSNIRGFKSYQKPSEK